MIISGAKLRINDSEFDIIRLNYSFYRKTDSKRRPVTGRPRREYSRDD